MKKIFSDRLISKCLAMLILLASTNTTSHAQMKYENYFGLYNNMGMPSYMKLKDTTYYFNPKKTMIGTKILMFDEDDVLIGNYTLNKRRQWKFTRRKLN